MRVITSMATAAAAAVALAAPATTANAQPAAAPEAKCKGHTVTINGTDGNDKIVGTPRADVIRTWKGDDVIKGRGGNDIICGDEGADTLIGGAGNDRLHGGPFKLIDYEEELGAKGDLLIGGRGNDRIFGGGSPENESPWVMPFLVVPDRVEFPEARGGITIDKRGVATGPGIGRDRLFGAQRVTGTRWADRITVRGEHIVAGKGGSDRITVLTGPKDGQIEASARGQRGDDRINLSRSAKGYYEVDGGVGRDRLTGSPRSEYIVDRFGRGSVRGGGSYDQISVTSRVSVRGDGGDDLLQIRLVKGHLRSIDGGAGRDRLELSNPTGRDLHINLPKRQLRVGRAAASLRRAEAYAVPARNADAYFVGSDRADRLSSFVRKGNFIRARLGGGDDKFNVGGPYGPAGRAMVYGEGGADELDGNYTHDRFFGGRGNDTLWGDVANDVLRGGPGHDKADGGPGKKDLCRAESKRQCER